MLKLNNTVLDISLANDNNEQVKMRDYLGKYVVLYFYPKDDTPGCTVEACSFRDANDEITKLGVKILGVSKDTVAMHVKFKEKYHLNFDLLADTETKLNEAFGVWQEKSFMGRKFMGTVRTTFIIDPQGNIVKRYDKVKPKGHSEEVLADLKELVKA